MKKEFEIQPSQGLLQAGDTQQVEIMLISTSVKTYDYYLTVDVVNVGDGLLSVPIFADCQVPDVTHTHACARTHAHIYKILKFYIILTHAHARTYARFVRCRT